MNEAYRPELADYFDQLEQQHGEGFTFDVLSDEAILKLEQLGRHAIEQDPQVTAEEKQALQPLLVLISHQRTRRGLGA